MSWLDIIKCLVRPYISITGWTAVVALAVILALRFATQDMALTILAILTGAVTTIMGYWFGERSARK